MQLCIYLYIIIFLKWRQSKYLNLNWYEPLGDSCTAELKLDEGKASQGDSHLCCSVYVLTKYMPIGRKSRVTEKLTHLLILVYPFTVQ